MPSSSLVLPFSDTVVQILKVGLAGVAFLFAYLTYRLLINPAAAKGQKYGFMGVVVTLTAILAVMQFADRHSQDVRKLQGIRDQAAQLDHCRVTLLRLGTLSASTTVANEDLRAAISLHRSACHDTLTQLIDVLNTKKGE